MALYRLSCLLSLLPFAVGYVKLGKHIVKYTEDARNSTMLAVPVSYVKQRAFASFVFVCVHSGVVQQAPSVQTVYLSPVP